ncbi:regulatory helix-turn-helix domain-containing lysR family protein [Listeria weihenstephanensis FSL R9-0317]|uniref:LysR family transcriptional regulator n=1 Tax=Listeria weihenstephanensis TaxID=1006155 RepID=A0A841Z9R1_9LIST|nr:LysR family transcriptional regulator [Listeria weihenstephanensis]EUJ40909.1 regulatory helix-turn-helix domain-containing lysR family protein [Listeria weihenstephanensis FSL R9-0317]MBC1501176.1 LysR family transcriptional regulator [Listeria weihenstephanensis]
MFQWLQTFMAVFEAQNFTKAAENLFISQPTVSLHIQKLEELTGSELFIRNGRNHAVPTESAELLYLRAKQLDSLWENSLSEIKQLQGNTRISYHIGASQTIGVYMLPQVLPQLQEAFPNYDFVIHIANSTVIFKKVDMHEYNVGLVESPMIAPTIERAIFAYDSLVLAGNQNSDLWLLRESGSGIRAYTDQFFQQENIIPKQKIEIASNEAILNMLQQGIGKTLLSDLSIRDLTSTAPPEAITRALFQIHHAEFPQDDFQMALYKLLLETFQ